MNFTKIYLLFFIFTKLSRFDCLSYNPNNYFSNIIRSVSTLDTIENYNISLFYGFGTFTDLVTNFTHTYETGGIVEFLPTRSLVIDRLFNIDQLLSLTQIQKIELLTLVNIKGIDIDQTAFFHQSQIAKLKCPMTLNVHFSKLDIYQNDRIVNECNLNVYKNSQSFLKPFFYIYFIKVTYPDRLCPLIFRNSFLTEIYFGDISNSFLISNRLIFSDLNFDSTETFEMYLNYFYSASFDFYKENLTHSILNKNLFKNIYQLNIFGILTDIEVDLFKSFDKLKYLDISISNFKDFFNRGNEWMKFLNKKVNVDLTDASSVLSNKDNVFMLKFRYERAFVSFDSIYDYPDEDLCLFKDFPHQNLVYPILLPGKLIKCTCTLIWLKFFSHLYEPLLNETFNYINDDNLFNENQNRNNEYKFCKKASDFSICDISTRLDNCKIEKLEKKENTFDMFRLDNDNDVYYFLKWLQLILLIILQPIFGGIGIINNLIVIITIKNKKHRHNFKDPMYNHIIINASFNIIYCSILILNILNTCLSFESKIFCSKIFQENSTQVFKIVVIHFLGNVFRLCSNFSYLYFSFCRFVLVSMYKDSNFLKKITQVNQKRYIFLLFFIACLLSSFRIFQYELNVERNPRKDFPFETRNEYFCQNKLNSFQCYLFNSFKILNRFLNDILCVVLNIFIDLFLFKNYNLHLRNKVALTRRRIRLDLDFHKDIKKKKKNLNRMIMLNGFIYIVSHIPEFLSSILLIVFSKKISHFCFLRSISCDILNEEMAFFSLISIVTQLYIFSMFDRNFRNSLKELKSMLILTVKLRHKNVPTINVPAYRFINLGRLFGDGLIT